MEGERSRKRVRVENREAKELVAPAAKGDTEEKEVTVVAPPPTEAEVDEFFAILKRMHVAIKYFEKGAARDNSSTDGNGQVQKLTRWEAEVNGVKIGGGNKVENALLDLNTVPEPEINL